MVRVKAALLGMMLAGLSSCTDRGPDAVTGIWSRSYTLEAFDCIGVIGFSDGGVPAGSWYTREGCSYSDTEAGYHSREGTYVILADDSLSLTTLRGSCADDRRETLTVSFSRSGGSLTLVDGATTNAYAAISGEMVLFPGHSLVRGCFVGTPLHFEAYPLTDLPLPDAGDAPD